MVTIATLESEDGTPVYLNPAHVAPIAPVVGFDCSLTAVRTTGAGFWRVKGEAADVAAHLFALAERRKVRDHHHHAELALTGGRWTREQADTLIALVNIGAAGVAHRPASPTIPAATPA